jgi:multisubunit Na+/H+ antiporter MnhF subunit
MQHYLNHRLVKRNRRSSRWMMFGGLGATIVAVLITFLQPALLIIAFGLMLVGGIVSQIGTAIYNRFGRSPRVDEILDISLKGLDDRFTVFHYYLGTNHALFTPNGAYALVPRIEQGAIAYEDGVWKHQAPRRRFSLGGSRPRVIKNIEKEAANEANRLRQYLSKRIPAQSDIAIEPLVVFLADDTFVRADTAPFIAVHRKKLKSAFRKSAGRRPFTPEDLQQLATYLKID